MTDIVEPLYVDARGNERSEAVIKWLLDDYARDFGMSFATRETLKAAQGAPYAGNGTMLAPFLTLDEARAVQKPGQPIVMTGYATIGGGVKH